MEKSFFKFCILGLFIFQGCKNNSNLNYADKLFKEHPATITWNSNETETIGSIHAEVEVYSMNSRKDNIPELSNRYNISVKMIDGVQYTRIDIGSGEEMNARTIITDGNEMIIYNPQSNEIESRIPALSENEKALRFFEPGNIGFSRVNLDFVKNTANKLLLDISEEDDNSSLCISLPATMLESSKFNRQISSKLVFDIENETLSSVENISIQPDGTTVTSTLSPVYEEFAGTLMKIGSVLVIETKVSEMIGVLADDYVIYDSYDDIAEISKEELDKMISTGAIHEEDFIIFGSPANLSNTETVIELYTDIKINQVEDSEFKILMQKAK